MFALTQGPRRAAQIEPEVISTHFSGRLRTWQQVLDQGSRVAGALFALSVRPGERVHAIVVPKASSRR
jgi:long-chain acyl-CoA synthetase